MTTTTSYEEEEEARLFLLFSWLNIIQEIEQKTSNTHYFTVGVRKKTVNTPTNKMGVTVSDLCAQSKKIQIFSIKKTDHIDLWSALVLYWVHGY